MNSSLRAGLVMGISLLLAGCIQTKDEYTLNPDGSGKVVHEAIMQPAMGGLNLSDQSDTPQDPAAQLTNAVKEELAQTKGVDAWKEISFGRSADGRIQFKATVYFPNLSKLAFYNGGFHSDFLVPSLKKDAQGGLELDLNAAKKSAKPEATPEAVPTDEAGIAAKIQEQKAQYQQMKPMMTMMLGTMLLQMKFHLPGQLAQANNFKRETPDTLSITMDGQKLLALIDLMIADDKWLREQVRAGKNLQQDNPLGDEVLNEKLYGERGPIRATIQAPLQPLFNYAAEVAAAKQAYPKYLKTAGLDVAASGSSPAPTAAAGAPFKSLTVGGVRMVFVADQKHGIRPFNETSGYSISLIGELPGSVLEVSGGKLDSAITDTGESLLPERDWDQKINFPRLTQDKTSVTFEIKMAMPGANVKSLKEVTGTIAYTVASGSHQVDLGITEFTAGSAGKELGAKISSLKESPYNKGQQTLSLKLAVPGSMVKKILFYNSDGTELKTIPAGTMNMDNSSRFEFSTEDKFPPTGRISVEVNDNLEKREIPFKLANISLLGKPL